MSNFLNFPEKISLKKAREKIEYYCTWGDVLSQYKVSNPRDVELALAKNKLNVNKLASYCRNYRKPIPYISNILPNRKLIKSGHGKVQIINLNTREKKNDLDESGILTLSTYQDKFRKSANSKNLAVEDDSNAYEHILTAISTGFASIEAYIFMKVEIWNLANPNNTLIDNANNKVNIETKINNWIPKMCNGNRIQINGKEWAYYKELKKLRDNHEVHPKYSTHTITFNELATIIDKYRYGIASLLASIHKCFNQNVPNLIIDSIFYPEVEVIK